MFGTVDRVILHLEFDGNAHDKPRSPAEEQCLAAVKPSHDVRAEIAENEVRLQSSMTRRATVDEALLKIVQRVINAVKADPEEGDDGDLYMAMGYVRRRDRDKGLTRRRREAKTPEAHSRSGASKDGEAQ